MSRHDLTDFEWRVIEPLLPNKPRGVPRVDDRRVLNGIFWVLRSGAPWRDLPERYGPRTTCYGSALMSLRPRLQTFISIRMPWMVRSEPLSTRPAGCGAM
jgi:transposase